MKTKRTFEDFLRAVSATPSDNGYEACCPAHDDDKPSLSITRGRNGQIVLHCHAGCAPEKVVGAIGWTMRDIKSTRGKNSAPDKPAKSCKIYPSRKTAIAFLAQHGFDGRAPDDVYIYYDHDGEPVAAVLRWNVEDGKKEIRQIRRHGTTGWVCKSIASPRPLYKLPNLDDDRIFVVEGEKCADAVQDLGLASTTSMGGSNAPDKSDWSPLAGKEVVILPDNDNAGRGYALTVARMLSRLDPSPRVKIVDIPVKSGDDVADWIDAGGTQEKLSKLADGAEEWIDSTDPDDLPQKLKETDAGNARRFVAMFGDKIRYCYPFGKWFVWDGKRWKQDDIGRIERWAKRVPDAIWRDGYVEWAAKSKHASRIAAMINLARSEPGIPILPDELDRQHHLLNCNNGTVDLRTGELLPHDPSDMLTKLCPTDYDPDARCKEWRNFLETTFAGNRRLIRYMRRLLGYCVTGDVKEQVLPIFWGGGSNGKSTLLAAVLDVVGKDYCGVASGDLLIKGKHDRHPTEIANLHGKRLVTTVESDEGRYLNESLIKQLTGGDRLSARRMREDFWDFAPTHKLVMCTNHRPQVMGTDHAIWRRIALIPFTQQFWDGDKGETGPDELRADKSLAGVLNRERNGILAWIVKGAGFWNNNGLRPPRVVKIATEEYRSDQDQLGRFVESACETGPEARTSSTKLYDHYEKWCQDMLEEPKSKIAFGKWIKERFTPTRKAGKGTRGYAGIAPRDNAPGVRRENQKSKQ